MILPKRRLRSDHFYNQFGLCAYCMCEMRFVKNGRAEDSATLEHIVPQTFGGKNTHQNTVAVCYRCNHDRGHKLLSASKIKNILILKGIDGLHPICVNIFKVISNGR